MIPSGHDDKQVDEPAGEYVPSSHGVQTVLLVAPIMLEYDPAGHVVHEEEPTVDEYDPAGHAVQLFAVPVVDEYVPRSHGVHALGASS